MIKIKKDMKAITAQMGYRSISGPKWRPPNGQRSGGPRPTQHTPISDLIWTGPGHSFLKFYYLYLARAQKNAAQFLPTFVHVAQQQPIPPQQIICTYEYFLPSNQPTNSNNRTQKPDKTSSNPTTSPLHCFNPLTYHLLK